MNNIKLYINKKHNKLIQKFNNYTNILKKIFEYTHN